MKTWTWVLIAIGCLCLGMIIGFIVLVVYVAKFVQEPVSSS